MLEPLYFLEAVLYIYQYLGVSLKLLKTEFTLSVFFLYIPFRYMRVMFRLLQIETKKKEGFKHLEFSGVN